MASELQWIQIDLEDECEIYAIAVWHDPIGPAVFNDVIVQVSNDRNFITGVKTLYNNDRDGSAGLPWSTLAGRVAAQKAVAGSTPYDRFFDPARAYSPIETLQPVLRKPLTFALSTYYAKHFETGQSEQVARQRRQFSVAAFAAGLLAGIGGTLALRRSKHAALR